MKRLLITFCLLGVIAGYAQSAYVWPVGIPHSDTVTGDANFTPDVNNWMLSGKTYDYSLSGEGVITYKEDATVGPYVYWINPTHPNATDTANPYGTPDVPRENHPDCNGLPAGTVMVIKNYNAVYGVYPVEAWGFIENCIGTADKPVFFVFDNNSLSSRPAGGNGGELIIRNCQYLVIDGFDRDMDPSGQAAINITSGDVTNAEATSSYVVIKNGNWYGGPNDPGGSYQICVVEHDVADTNYHDNIIFYNNTVHTSGQLRTGTSKDAVAFSIRTSTRNVWVLDNTIYEIGGDAIQVDCDNAGLNGDGRSMPNNIYIGRNTGYDFWENFLDLKTCKNMVVSQNICYNTGRYSAYGDPNGSSQYRYGFQDNEFTSGKSNIWTIFNKVYNSDPGGGSAVFQLFHRWIGYDEPYATGIYFIGNLVYDCEDANNAASSYAFRSQLANGCYFINNTAYNVDAGFALEFCCDDPCSVRGGQAITFQNNIIYDVNENNNNNKYEYGRIQDVNVIDAPNAAAIYAGITFSNNMLYDPDISGPNIATWFATVGAGGAGVVYESVADFKTSHAAWSTQVTEEDPLFVNGAADNYQLTDGSPAVDVGADVSAYETTFNTAFGTTITVDYGGFGKPVNTDYDLGAYENQTAIAGTQYLLAKKWKDLLVRPDDTTPDKIMKILVAENKDFILTHPEFRKIGR